MQRYLKNGVPVCTNKPSLRTACKDAFCHYMQIDARGIDCPNIGITNDQNAIISFNP